METPEVLPSLRTVGDELIKGLWLLGRVIFHLQKDHGGPKSAGDVKVYFDTLYLIQPRFADLQEKLHFGLFSPWHEENRGRST